MQKKNIRTRHEIRAEITEKVKSLNGWGNHCRAYGEEEAIAVFGCSRDEIVESLRRLEEELSLLDRGGII